ncbi:Glucan endo-1,3-beta-glucosidase [Acorus calamus]|uniref:Glucan endo-1,3-beta-glucosidase n=1 Tax=Acorus calamus TaxID=4465 RepID=A0AAV9CLU6_ACOCL|nr:Glucan endo-1,3-beta-glucosidase [Acorus calamus]
MWITRRSTIRNLIRHVTSGVGTPLMPNRTFETYVFALFNEDLKPGPVSERNFGLFRADLTPVYDVGLLRTSQSETPRMSEPLNPTEEMQWCVARADVGLDALQANIDYVCGLGLNCLPIQDGGECFFPNNVRAHAGYAMNEYYRSNGRNPFDCDFRHTGVLTGADPSSGGCKYS